MASTWKGASRRCNCVSLRVPPHRLARTGTGPLRAIVNRRSAGYGRLHEAYTTQRELMQTKARV